MVVAASNSIGAYFRKISSNSALRLRNSRVSVSWRDKTSRNPRVSLSRRDKTSRNSRFWLKTSLAVSNRWNIARNSCSVTGFLGVLGSGRGRFSSGGFFPHRFLGSDHSKLVALSRGTGSTCTPDSLGPFCGQPLRVKASVAKLARQTGCW